jgi:hypothetical protein
LVTAVSGEAFEDGVNAQQGQEGSGLVATFRDEQMQTGLRSWSRARWLVVVGVLVAIAVAVILVLVYSGGGSSGGGGGY